METLEPYHFHSSYVDSNHTIRDARWNEFESERGWVALSHAWATQHGMSEGLSMPDDSEKGLFIINAYHQMHCLVRNSF